jgi:hypothetical protein
MVAVVTPAGHVQVSELVKISIVGPAFTPNDAIAPPCKLKGDGVKPAVSVPERIPLVSAEPPFRLDEPEPLFAVWRSV